MQPSTRDTIPTFKESEHLELLGMYSVFQNIFRL